MLKAVAASYQYFNHGDTRYNCEVTGRTNAVITANVFCSIKVVYKKVLKNVFQPSRQDKIFSSHLISDEYCLHFDNVSCFIMVTVHAN